MAKITLFWLFWTKMFLDKMMEFQVKFSHHSGLRLWRTEILFSTKSKGHKSNFRISWMYRSCFYDLKVHFWWPNKCSKHQVLRSNTLYMPWNLLIIKVLNIFWYFKHKIPTWTCSNAYLKYYWTNCVWQKKNIVISEDIFFNIASNRVLRKS